MSENENIELHEDSVCSCEDQKKAKKDKTLTVYDLFMAIFYVIIIAVGVNLCAQKGLNANVMHLAAVTISLGGVFALKIAKFRKALKEHIPDVAFSAILFVLALFALAAKIF